MKLSIRPPLYLLSVAWACGIVLNVWGTLNPGIAWDPNEMQIRPTVKDLLDRGTRALPDIGQWRYDKANPFWKLFDLASFTGHQPDELDNPTPPPGPTNQEDVGLGQKIDVVWISYGGDYTRVVVRYREPGEVGTQPPLHHVELGDHLWKPLQSFYLVGVAEDARSALFENRAKEKIDNEYPRQEVHKAELQLQVDVKRRSRVLAVSGYPTPPEAEEPLSEEWRVSPEDLDYINHRGNRFLHEDVSLDDYSGRIGPSEVHGVRVRRLGERARGLGIQERDVLISLNGAEVKSRAQFIREGKRLWRQGARCFELVLLRKGQETSVTYRFRGK